MVVDEARSRGPKLPGLDSSSLPTLPSCPPSCQSLTRRPAPLFQTHLGMAPSLTTTGPTSLCLRALASPCQDSLPQSLKGQDPQERGAARPPAASVAWQPAAPGLHSAAPGSPLLTSPRCLQEVAMGGGCPGEPQLYCRQRALRRNGRPPPPNPMSVRLPVAWPAHTCLRPGGRKRTFPSPCNLRVDQNQFKSVTLAFGRTTRDPTPVNWGHPRTETACF